MLPSIPHQGILTAQFNPFPAIDTRHTLEKTFISLPCCCPFHARAFLQFNPFPAHYPSHTAGKANKAVLATNNCNGTLDSSILHQSILTAQFNPFPANRLKPHNREGKQGCVSYKQLQWDPRLFHSTPEHSYCSV